MEFGQLILKPKSFFGDLSSQPANMYIATVIVILAAYLNIGASINAGRNIMPASNWIAVFLFNLILAGLVSGAVMWLLAWLPIKVFSGIGKRSLEIAAWTLVPQCFNGLLSTIFSFLFPFYIVNSEFANGGGKIIKSAIHSQVYHLFSYLAVLWTLYLLYCAVYSFTKDKKKTNLTFDLSFFITLCMEFLIPAFAKMIIR